VHDELTGDAWLIGRVTGQESPRASRIPRLGTRTFHASPGSRDDAKAYGVVLDSHGKIGWGRSDIGGDPIVVS